MCKFIKKILKYEKEICKYREEKKEGGENQSNGILMDILLKNKERLIFISIFVKKNVFCKVFSTESAYLNF